MAKENKSNIIIYQSEDGQTHIEVQMDEDTVWLSQQQMADLYQTSRTNVVEHIKHIYEDGELVEESTCRKIRQVRQEGARMVEREIPHYNLDMIISLGYRINSIQATHFRQWATARLKEYIIKGFTIDDERLKQLGGGYYWKELLDRIRDIRSSEKVMYRQVLDIYATAVDYDPHAKQSIEFFKIVQNKLHFAAHGHTAAEVIYERADADQHMMGLTSFKVQAIKHRPMYMNDYIKHLDAILSSTGEVLLMDAGMISHEQAMDKAETEYRKWEVRTLSPVEQAYLNSIKTLNHKTKKKG